MPRPLHLGPICCCWSCPIPQPQTPMYLSTHQRCRAASGEPQSSSTFSSISESGAQPALAPGEWEHAGLVAWGRQRRGQPGAFSLVSLFNGILAVAGGQLCPPPSIHGARVVLPGITSAVTVMGHRQVPVENGLGRVEKRKTKSWQICKFGAVFSQFSARILPGPCRKPHCTVRMCWNNPDTGSTQSHPTREGVRLSPALKPRRNPTHS